MISATLSGKKGTNAVPTPLSELALLVQGNLVGDGNTPIHGAGPLTEAVLLGNVALRLGMREELTNKRLLWDPVGFKFTNSERANQFLRREYRHGWTLG